ncbi:hypothetical protein QJ857_gp0004 [Tupanvirus soda lake]|uniref:Uncharacterized protein n=1 Tax=Tupanvirus deep ocean TaxID=2126984 RepID=A0AC59HBX3_9VIRU|nr:hypothetical protein QJ857_gp0004 [Tupanvirus soda lake]AUL77472.2 hypothetical protein [Tupanvirus soda lake]
MDNLLNFYRGLIIVEPYGTYIRKREKNIIVKSKIIKSIIEENLLLIENKIGFGIIRLSAPKKINISEFNKLRKYHMITETDRKKWWPNYKYLYAYKINKTNFFKTPLLLDYVSGPQITVLPKNITIKKIFIGMSGYYYKYMYPSGTKNILNYYGSALNSVEINSTFYRFPDKSMILNLKNYDLAYSIKVNQYITHSKKLNDIGKYWKQFYYAFDKIHDKIYCFLFQFSPEFYFNNETFKRLKKLELLLNKNHRYVFEFRNMSWFGNSDVFNLFNKNNWIIVISNLNNHNGWAGDLLDGYNPSLKNYLLTSDSVYFRMHGTTAQYTGSYDDYEFKKIYNFISKKPIKYAFIYFNNTDDGHAFKNSIRMRNKFNILNSEIDI